MDIEGAKLLEQWYVQKSAKNFWVYRRFIRGSEFIYNWFLIDLARNLQQFYIDYRAGLKPILIINTPPQHGKSWAINDFMSWICPIDPSLRVIFTSYSDSLSERANTYLQRTWDSHKFKSIFPDFIIPEKSSSKAKRNINKIDYFSQQTSSGYFYNTTCGGSVTGETLDIGVIDDPIKGRKQAESKQASDDLWDWFTDDFFTRGSKNAGYILCMTRWVVNDLAGRLYESYKNKHIKICKYKAISDIADDHRGKNVALFPELKPLSVILDAKRLQTEANFQSMFQQEPIKKGGNIVKKDWWQWWSGELPVRIQFKFITIDTAQKAKNIHDYTIFHAWGYGVDSKLYQLDRYRKKLEAPELRKAAELFYKKHDTKRKDYLAPILRGCYIEDKSSGIGLIQELRRKKLIVYEIPRNNDKVFRATEIAPYIEMGNVVLCKDLEGVENLVEESIHFPNDIYDDEFDSAMSAIELVYIEEVFLNSLVFAMDD